MAKRKNVVKQASGLTGMIVVLMIVVGWLLAASVVLLDDTAAKQAQVIESGREFLKDKLYVRAADRFVTALRDYKTDQNLAYETELLSIYKEGNLMDQYYALIDSRRSSGTAQVQEYVDRAQGFLDDGSTNRAVDVLKEGVAATNSEELINLYESLRYEYQPTSTTFTELVQPSADWYVPAFDGEHWGYIGSNGRTLLEFQYEEALPFSGNYAAVKLNGVYTLIDKDGNWNAIDKEGLDQVTMVAGTRLVGVKDGQYRIYTNTFFKTSDETYENVYLSDNGIAAVQKGGKWALLNGNLEPVTDYIFTDVAVNSRGQVFSGDYAVVADESGYFLINSKGEPYFEARFANAKGMEGGLFAVADASGKWGFANEKAEVIVPCEYEDACSFSNYLGAVKVLDEWGYVNRYNMMIIEPQFDQAYPFVEGCALTVGGTGYYDVLKLKFFDQF